jgi:hypothetical protein
LATDTKNKLLAVRNRSFLNKDFNNFRVSLLDYARTYFPDRIQDFSEASLGGLLLDLAAYVGDVSSFYLDHQFRELDHETAVERANIERLARNAGVKISGAAPAVADVTFSIRVPASRAGTVFQPRESALPTIGQNSTVISDSGIVFSLTEDIDFAERNTIGELIADVEVFSFGADGTPEEYTLSLVGSCISGDRSTEGFSIEDTEVRFRTITLGNSNVGEILDVRDAEGNVYYEVEALSQDTVFRSYENLSPDNKVVKQKIEIIPAPYRFVRESSNVTGLTTLRFGAGDSRTLDGDVVPDPSELALPLYGKKVFSKFTIDPSRLLNTRTLGVSPRNTTLTVQYRSGGGLDHNISAQSINSVGAIIANFPGGPSVDDALTVKASVDVQNIASASGGEDPPSIEEIRSLIGASRNLQNRVVTKQDLLARIYTMPASFGRVFRAGIAKNNLNPLATNLYIASRDNTGGLSVSPDTLKINLRNYLNEFRLVSDAVDILDANIVNLGVNFEIAVDPNFNSEAVLSRAIDKLIEYLAIENMQIDMTIRTSDIINLIYNTPGVLSVVNVSFQNIFGKVGERAYPGSVYDVAANTVKGFVIPPEGGIFEIRYPSSDIKGSVI